MTPVVWRSEQDPSIPCGLRQECACGRHVTTPLTGSGPEVTRDWVCPICSPDFEANFRAWRAAHGRRDEE